MNKKVFSESQIILFMVLILLAILILLPVSKKIYNISINRKHDKEINRVINASKKWLNDNNNDDKKNIYIEVNKLYELKYLSKQKISGCIKISYNDKTNDYTYTYNNSICDDIKTASDLIISSNDDLTFENNKYVFKGRNPNNYFLINGILYRIISLNNNIIRVIRNTNIESRSFDSSNIRDNQKNSYCLNSNGCNMYISDGVLVNQDSEIKEYLENVYSKIEGASKILVTDTFNIGLVSNLEDYNIKSKTITSNIGLLNIEEYINASNDSDYTKDNWLNNDTNYWLINGYSNNNSDVYYVSSFNKIKKTNASDLKGVRPVININGNLKINGRGTKEEPYVLNTK